MGLVADRTPPTETDDSRYALAPDTSLGRLRQGLAGMEFECGAFGLSSFPVRTVGKESQGIIRPWVLPPTVPSPHTA